MELPHLEWNRGSTVPEWHKCQNDRPPLPAAIAPFSYITSRIMCTVYATASNTALTVTGSCLIDVGNGRTSSFVWFSWRFPHVIPPRLINHAQVLRLRGPVDPNLQSAGFMWLELRIVNIWVQHLLVHSDDLRMRFSHCQIYQLFYWFSDHENHGDDSSQLST